MFRNFELMLIFRVSPTLKECLDSKVFDKMEILSNLESLDAEKLMNLSVSVGGSDDESKEEELYNDADLQEIVDKMCKKYQKTFSHFSSIGMPPILECEKEDFQILTKVEPDGSLSTVAIPKGVEVQEVQEKSPAYLKNFLVINLRSIRRSLRILPTDGRVEIQQNLISKILSEVKDKIRTVDEPRGSRSSTRAYDQRQSRHKRNRSPSIDSRKNRERRRSPSKMSEKHSSGNSSEDQNSRYLFTPTASKSKQLEEVSQSKSQNFDPPKPQFNPFTFNQWAPPTQNYPQTPTQNFQAPTQNFQNFQGQQFWTNARQPIPATMDVGPITGSHFIPGVGQVWFPPYEGQEVGEARAYKQIELNKAILQQKTQNMSGQTFN